MRLTSERDAVSSKTLFYIKIAPYKERDLFEAVYVIASSFENACDAAIRLVGDSYQTSDARVIEAREIQEPVIEAA
jgi:hypothetical protein